MHSNLMVQIRNYQWFAFTSFAFLFWKKKHVRKKQLVQDLIPPPGKAATCGLELEQGAQVPNTKRHMRLRLYPYTHAHIHPCSHRHTTTQVTITQRQLPPRTMAFASITNGICQHNQRHLHALQGICPLQQKGFASTTQSICLQNSRTPRPKIIVSTHTVGKTIVQQAGQRLIN